MNAHRQDVIFHWTWIGNVRFRIQARADEITASGINEQTTTYAHVRATQ